MSLSFVVTNKGLALLAKMAAGELLEISSVRSGAGTVDSTLLKEQTAITTQKQELAVQNISYTSDSECTFILSLNNVGLENGYTLKQIGVFAHDPDEGEILYCIYQDDSGVNHNIPSEMIVPGYNAEWECYLKFNQATTVNVSVDPANTVSQAVMEKYVNDRTTDAINDMPAELIRSKLDEAYIITTTGNGAAYVATVPGITELKTGVSFIMIPHATSEKTEPTLNVNGLGAKAIRQPLTTNTGATTTAAVGTWLTAGKPVRVRYEGKLWEIDIPRPSATSLYGSVPVANGGTGADNPAEALLNLGAQKAPTYANGWSIADICALEGIFYIDAEDDSNPDGTSIIGIADGYSAVALSASGKTFWANATSTQWTGNTNYEVLWENASPYSSFRGQGISIPSLSDYFILAIVTSKGTFFISTDTTDYQTIICTSLDAEEHSIKIHMRKITVGSNVLTIGDNYKENLQDTNGYDAENQTFLVPHVVYGVYKKE